MQEVLFVCVCLVCVSWAAKAVYNEPMDESSWLVLVIKIIFFVELQGTSLCDTVIKIYCIGRFHSGGTAIVFLACLV